MTLYAIVDEDLKIVSHVSKGKLAIFSNLKVLKNNAWRYERPKKVHKIAEFEITEVYSLESEEE